MLKFFPYVEGGDVAPNDGIEEIVIPFQGHAEGRECRS